MSHSPKSLSFHLKVVRFFEGIRDKPNMKRTAFFLGLMLATASSTQAATIASWGFEINQPPTVTANAVGNIQPDFGSGQAMGSHANSSTTFTSAVGNGSAHSFIANNWSVGDFW